MTQIGNPDHFCANYLKSKIFTKIGKFQSEVLSIERKSSSRFSPKARLFLAIVKAAKPFFERNSSSDATRAFIAIIRAARPLFVAIIKAARPCEWP